MLKYMNKSISFIGTGKMAAALISAIYSKNLAKSIIASDHREENLRNIKSKFDVRTTTNNKETVRSSDIVFICVKPQDIDEALIKKALELNPGNGAYIDSLGWVYFKKGMLEDARKELEKAQETIGEDPVVYDHLGDVYFKTGMLDKAKEAWTKSIGLKEDKKVKEKLNAIPKNLQ